MNGWEKSELTSFLLACFALTAGALAVASCLNGCIPGWTQMSPAEAQRIERAECEKKPDAEARRICFGRVARKYGRYNSEGGYPEQWMPPSPTQ